jgi:hypothetical protein
MGQSNVRRILNKCSDCKFVLKTCAQVKLELERKIGPSKHTFTLDIGRCIVIIYNQNTPVDPFEKIIITNLLNVQGIHQ